MFQKGLKGSKGCKMVQKGAKGFKRVQKGSRGIEGFKRVQKGSKEIKIICGLLGSVQVLRRQVFRRFCTPSPCVITWQLYASFWHRCHVCDIVFFWSYYGPQLYIWLWSIPAHSFHAHDCWPFKLLMDACVNFIDRNRCKLWIQNSCKSHMEDTK